MGFQVFIDILGSVFIGGILLLTLLNMKAANTENMYRYSGNEILQGNLVTLTEILDNDLKQIGIGRDSTWSNRLQIATRTRIQFFTDINLDGTKDNIEYNFSGPDNSTANPKDTLLTRSVNGVSTDFNFGVVKFKLTYRDIGGNLISNPLTQTNRNLINSIQIDVQMQSTYILKRDNVADADQYNKETIAWRRVFFPYKSRIR